MSEITGGLLACHRIQCGPQPREQRVHGASRLASQQRLKFGEHQLNRIEVWTVGWEKHQLTALRFDERPNGRSVMSRQVIHDHDLSRLQGRAQHLAHIPLENRAIDRPFDDQRGHWPHQPQRTDQGVVLAPVAGHATDGALVTGRASIPSYHGGIEATLVQEDQPFRRLEERREGVEELRAQFLILFGRDPRFFYR